MLRAPWGRARDALALLDAGDIEAARRALEAVTVDWPNYATGHKLLALLLLDMGDSESARHSLERALQLDPADASALHAMTVAHQRLGDLEGARRTSALLRRLRPFDESVLALCDAVGAEPVPTPRLEDATAEEARLRIAQGARAVEEVLGPIDMGTGDQLPPALQAPATGPPRNALGAASGQSGRDDADELSPVWGRSAPGLPRVDTVESAPRPAESATMPDRAEAASPPARTLADELAARSAPPIETVTIADIYVEQGLYQQAMQIYKKHQEFRPGDESLAKRIRELEEKITQEDVD